jgi:hypothetical protein
MRLPCRERSGFRGWTTITLDHEWPFRPHPPMKKIATL